MKNNNKRNNIVYSKSRSSQFIFALVCILILCLFVKTESKAQCSTSNLKATAVVTNGVCGNDGAVSVSASGGNSPYAYTWLTMPGETSPTVDSLRTWKHTIVVTDADGCTDTVEANVVNAHPRVLGNVVSIPASCGGSNGAVVMTINRSDTSVDSTNTGVGPFTYLWSTGSTDSIGLSGLSPSIHNTVYSVTVTDVYGCSYSFSNVTSTNIYNHKLPKLPSTVIVDTCDLVWPGDANRDLVVNNNDLLAVGIGFGAKGYLRSWSLNFSTYNWVGQICADWGKKLSNGTDYKNVATTGLPEIGAWDTVAIIKNYSLTHALKLAKPEYVTGLPDLTYTIPVDTTLAGTTIKVPIVLGSSTNPANNIYGLAFSITYDPKIVDTTKLSLSLAGSWLGTNGTNLIYITKNFGSMGRMDIGITRTDHQNISGFGTIGDLSITMRDNIQLKVAETFAKTLTLDAVQIKAIDKDENLIPLNAVSDDVVVVNANPLSINRYKANVDVRVYPNPASGLINIALGTADVKELKLVNIIGETVWQQNNNFGNKIAIDAQTLPAGTYYLSVTTSQERVIKQVNVIK
ncbi:MAG: T9SS type A sorting domain-containing protein [Bacteroidia bacterium]|nr:T9SS type A sorting domain-containing protein [Bacteroidia bacterium]